MKTVFTNSQLCHVWANQSQSAGRGSNMFFRDTMIFSYGEHYMAAKIHTVKGKRFALVNSHRYSNSTCKHLNLIQRALRGLMPSFIVSDVTNLKTALLDMDKHAQSTLVAAMKRSKVTSKTDIEWELQWINDAFKTANELRKILGKAEKFPTKKQLDTVETHLKARLARYQELNSPEMQAKRQADKVKRDVRKAELAMQQQAERITKFRQGESVQIHNLPFELLRIRGDVVETSRGAQVPLSEAQSLLQSVINKQTLPEATVGSFQLREIVQSADDTIIRIGCHNILLSEAVSVLMPLKRAA